MKPQTKRWLAKEWLILLGCAGCVFLGQFLPELSMAYKKAEEEKESKRRISEWLKSEDKFEREIAQVLALPLNDAPKTPPAPIRDTLSLNGLNYLLLSGGLSPFAYLTLWIPRLTIRAIRTLLSKNTD